MHLGWALALAFITFWVGVWTTASSLSAAREILSAAFHNVSTAVAVVSALSALLTLTVQLWVGSRQAKIGEKQANASQTSAEAAMLTAKHAGDRAIATMRLKWIEELRSVLSEYHAILVTREQIAGEDRIKVCDLGTQLDLLLNQENPEQRALWEVADEIFKTNDLSKRKSLDESLVRAGRKVLKEE